MRFKTPGRGSALPAHRGAHNADGEKWHLRGAIVARYLADVKTTLSLMWRIMRVLPVAAALPALAGCESTPALDPVAWWHALEGGKIADQRPPPPNVDAPYPNLSTVPDRPPPPDLTARAAIVAGVAADRANAQYTQKTDPIPDNPAPIARPAPPPPAPEGDEMAGASLPAATTQPAGATRAATAAAPFATPPATPAQPPPAALPGELPPIGEGKPAAPVASLPVIPAAPPPPPNLPGAPGKLVPTPLTVVPPAPPPPPAPKDGPVLVAFPDGSSVLPKDAVPALLRLGHTAGTPRIEVTGFGDADPATDFDVQALALPLALARARAIATQLRAAGVPENRLRVSAVAEGHGGAARLAD